MSTVCTTTIQTQIQQVSEKARMRLRSVVWSAPRRMAFMRSISKAHVLFDHHNSSLYGNLSPSADLLTQTPHGL